jgi:hypothetical protein
VLGFWDEACIRMVLIGDEDVAGETVHVVAVASMRGRRRPRLHTIFKAR